MQNNEAPAETTQTSGLACFECDHVSADLVELHNHIWRNH